MTNQEITDKINRLKKEKNAIILAHYYTRPEVQDAADYLGDSLGLSQEAGKTNADLIVFCGVHFMAETASIISPDKKYSSPHWAPDVPLLKALRAMNSGNGKKPTPTASSSATSIRQRK